jgi:predicted GNAT superfamily acetyltransferase
MPEWTISVLEMPEEMSAVEELQRLVWPGSETDIVPAHMLLAIVHNGGLALGAFVDDRMVGMVFGFPGTYMVPDGPHLKHHSHMLAVHPDFRDSGLGFALKRAQWQMVRHQGIDRITWTYDPLLSRNAYLNIARLGAVCDTYISSFYGEMRDGLNVGLPSDRFQVDWWLESRRVERRLSRKRRKTFKLEDFQKAEVQFLYEADTTPAGWLCPPGRFAPPEDTLAVAEIPPDFIALKTADMRLARDWRFFARDVFTGSFQSGYLVTDFIYDRSGEGPRSFYVLAYGDSTLQES